MAKAAKTPMKAGGAPGTPGPKTPKMKPQHTPKGKPHTPGMKNGTPAKTPKKTPKPQPDTPMPPRQTPKTAPPTPKVQQTPKAQKTPKAQQTPKVQQTPKAQQTPKPKQKTQQQQKQINPPTPKMQQKSPKEQQKKVDGPAQTGSRDAQSRTVRLTFPSGTLQSIEQVKKLVPTATSVKFPNVVFVEFGSEAEADKQHAKLQPLIVDGQLHQVTFIGEKEREFQANNRSLDNTRLFVRGIGNASEADIKKLFPTATAVAVRGPANARKNSHRFCFVVFATAAACKEALEKSKGLTLFGNPLTVNYAFMMKGAGGEEVKAEKRPAEAAAAAAATSAPTKKLKVEPNLKEEEDDAAAVAAAPAKKLKVDSKLNEEEDDDDDDEDEDEDDEGEEEEDEDDDGEDEEGDDDEDEEDEDEDDDDDDDDDDDEEDGEDDEDEDDDDDEDEE